ncbi:hypothetical protein QU665_08080 [Actinomyces oris]|uniref:Uncharacterized protein n=1 Tax=Actinomyces oris TaxID=544580 RepID=A0AAW9KVJ9_9ACTO|nr:hypothetical protein [Actinomyces oris]MEA1305023.1 hypothetical protein [Actinomyces oris]
MINEIILVSRFVKIFCTATQSLTEVSYAQRNPLDHNSLASRNVINRSSIVVATAHNQSKLESTTFTATHIYRIHVNVIISFMKKLATQRIAHIAVEV